MNLMYYASDMSGPGFYRCLLPGQEMHRFGHEAWAPDTKRGKTGAFIYEVGDNMPDADCYILQQRPETFWLQMIPQLQALGKIVVAETDDYYAGIPPGHRFWTRVAKDMGLTTRKKVFEYIINPLHAIYAAADAMTVSTPFLKRAYSKLNKNITVIPNYLDWKMWEGLDISHDWERLRIGWMGEAQYRPDDLRVLQGMIGPWLERHPEVDFVAAGDPTIHDLLAVPEGQRVSYERVLFDDVPSITNTMDVGLVPLARHGFNEAKSALKGMEYAACGIPCIATPTESYQSWVEEGKNGFLAKQPRDWIRHLDFFGSDTGRAKARQMGRLAWWKAQEHTIQKQAWRWGEFYNDLAGDEYDQLARTAISRQALQKPSEFSAFLRFLGGREKLSTVVEIGTAQGGTLGALLSVAAPDALVVSLDLPGGDWDEKSEDDKYGKRDTDKMAAYRRPFQRLEFLQADSHARSTRATLERLLEGKRIDLLFIDGDHTYEGVKQDWEMYMPFVAPGGCVAFHDILPHSSVEWSGVDRLWAEIKEHHRTREFSVQGEERGWGQWGGIGVIEFAGKEIPQHQEAIAV